MPGVVKTPADERRWNNAKAAVKKSYPELKGKGDKFYRLVMHVFQRMKAASLAARRARNFSVNNPVKDIYARFFPRKSSILLEGSEAQLFREWTTEQRKEAARKGQAMPDGSYPIVSVGDLKKAIQAYGRSPDAETKRHIVKRARGLGHTDMLPAKWKGSTKPAAATAIASADINKLLATKYSDGAPSGSCPTPESEAKVGTSPAEEQGISVCAVALFADSNASNHGVPDWIQVLPAGKFKAVDGRGPFYNEDPEAIVKASLAKMPEAGLVLDYDHSTDLAAPEGRPAPAAGWLKGFKVVNEAIFALVEWTKDAADKIREKQYRYISPVFIHSKAGEVERILRAALTNNPALINLPAIASACGAGLKEEEMEIEKKKEVSTMAKKEEAAAMPKLSDVMKALESAHPAASPMKLLKAAAVMMADDEDGGDLSFNDWAEQEADEPEHQPEQAMDEDDDDMDDDDDDDAMAGKMPDSPYETESQMASRHEEEMRVCRAEGKSEEEMAALAAKHAKEVEDMKSRMAKDEMAKKEDMAKKDEMARKEDMSVKPTKANRMQRMASRAVHLTNKEIASLVAKSPAVVAMADELNNMRAERAKASAEVKVNDAIRQGRIIPAHKEWAVEYCSSDPKGFDAFLAKQPRIIQSGADGTITSRIGEPPAPGPGSLGKKAITILQNLGIESEKELTLCAQIQDKWNLRFGRPSLRMDDSQ